MKLIIVAHKVKITQVDLYYLSNTIDNRPKTEQEYFVEYSECINGSCARWKCSITEVDTYVAAQTLKLKYELEDINV